MSYNLTVTIPGRVRTFLRGSSLTTGDPDRHGYGEAGNGIDAKIIRDPAYTARKRYTLTEAEADVLCEMAEALHDVSRDDARWDNDAKADREAAARMIEKLTGHRP